MAKINQRIDRLTNSIVNKLSGDSFDTDVIAITKTELKSLTKQWKFNWVEEYGRGKIYKLVIRHYPQVIQGLVSLIDKNDHLFNEPY